MLLIWSIIAILLSAEDILVLREEQVYCNMPDTKDIVACENQDEEAVAMIESPSGSHLNLGLVHSFGLTYF